MIELDAFFDHGAKIRVVGVGGGGGNAINSMIEKRLQGVDFFAINCDMQSLDRNKAPNKIQIGKNLTRGLGAGADPSIGQRAVEEDRDEITRAITGSDMVFVTAGMGGGTGTGGGPIVANIAKSVGALVVGIVTRPFTCEGKKRMNQADGGIEEMKKQVDTLIVIPNQKLLSIVERNTPLQEAFDRANDVLYNATRGISELITTPGLINVDFADVRTIMREMGDALMGSGVATGENRLHRSAGRIELVRLARRLNNACRRNLALVAWGLSQIRLSLASTSLRTVLMSQPREAPTDADLCSCLIAILIPPGPEGKPT